MTKQYIEQIIQTALQQLQSNGELTVALPRIQVEGTKDKLHGDFACNIALVLAKAAARKPRELAEIIIKALPQSPNIAKVEIAGPGFINFFLTPQALSSVIEEIIKLKQNYGRSELGKGKKVLLEFVSSNPTGPLHVGHGRHAAFGAAIANLLETAGYSITREYYVNDGGRQMDILAASVWLRYLEICGQTLTLPANAYQGTYVLDIAQQLRKDHAEKYVFPVEKVWQDLPLDEPEGGDKEIFIDALIARAKKLLGKENYQIVFDLSLAMILRDIAEDLSEFGVKFDHWFSEREFAATSAVDDNIKALQKRGLIYEREGALWFKATDFGDEKDRVLQRANGQRTYFANDFAYHVSKFVRGFDLVIDIFGSDHHGYIPRMQAGLKASNLPPEKLIYLLLQFVTLYRGGAQVQMSTRSGSFVTLRELRTEVGNDAARFFYVMRKGEQHMDFDMDLAKSQSNENPVFYIQYAHARIHSVLRQMREKQMLFDLNLGLANVERLLEVHELQLLSTLSRYADVIKNAAIYYEPHILTNYLRDLANDFHVYYNSHQFLVDDDALRNARLALILATQQIIANGLTLLGVSAPDSM